MTARYTLDTPLADLEFNVRTERLLKEQGYVTLRDAAAGLDTLKRHVKGWGTKSHNELKEMIHYASSTQSDVLLDKEYSDYIFQDRLTAATSLIQSVQGRMLNAAMRGRVSDDVRREMAFKLRDAAAALEQLPTG